MGADTWSTGAAYEPYVGRWSRLVADMFLAWLDQPAGMQWLDVGCGTGALTETILQGAAPKAVVSIDPSEGYVAYARGHLTDPRVRFSVGDAQALSESSGTFDAVVSGLVLNFVPRPAQAVGEMVRVARAGAVVAAYVWDYAGQMQLMRYFWEAAVALDSTARPLDEGVRFPLCRPEPLAALWRTGGLREVEVQAIDVPTVFRDFDDYWSPFLGGQGPAPSYAMSRDETQREQLRERIRSRLPIAADGSIALHARAWAVRGQH